ncbi:MAG: GH32 C-terminal domain-containing protein [Paludibacteraceae bacterium]|nr:GH32 C-terminal domain-containing protein [Paludibacteraceae bacterium]
MKKFLIPLFAVLVILLAVGFKASKDKQQKKIKITTAYLLLPVEENADEVKTTIKYPDKKLPDVFWIRLAQRKVDYWVKLEVGKYKGKNVELIFDGPSVAKFGIKRIKPSNHFKVNYDEPYRPDYHFSPEYGWMNDPNGLTYFEGEYHLFYQYNPFGTRWGNMSWGHAVSTDLTSWTYLPVALWPDTLGAIFSGSVVIDKNNTAGFGRNAMIAIYTSAGKVQSQSLAYSTDKGRTFTKFEKNPIIPNPGITDFRDPKVSWYQPENKWIMALATKQTVTFYSSLDLKNWNRESEFGEGIGSHAGVWECPDLFPLSYEGKTKWVLLVSINPGGPNGGSATQYFVGDFDGKKFQADPLPYPLWIDYGRDNYAGVTFSNIPEIDGRRIFLGWMNNWDYANQTPTKIFRSSNTVPRELQLVNYDNYYVLSSYPVKEVDLLRSETIDFPDQFVNNEKSLKELLKQNDGSFELNMILKPEKGNVFGFSLQNSKGEVLDFIFDLSNQFVNIQRNNSGLVGFNDHFPLGMNAPLLPKKSYEIRLLVDKCSAELFIDHGEIVMTSLFYPREAMNSLKFFSKEGTLKIEDIKVSDLK